jgi:hypothetical protein
VGGSGIGGVEQRHAPEQLYREWTPRRCQRREPQWGNARRAPGKLGREWEAPGAAPHEQTVGVCGSWRPGRGSTAQYRPIPPPVRRPPYSQSQ